MTTEEMLVQASDEDNRSGNMDERPDDIVEKLELLLELSKRDVQRARQVTEELAILKQYKLLQLYKILKENELI